MRICYCQWRFRGIDPYSYLRGGHPHDAWVDGHEAVMTAFAEYAADQERAMTDLGSALAGIV